MWSGGEDRRYGNLQCPYLSQSRRRSADERGAIEQGIPPDQLRQEENQILIEHMTTLDKRQAMAGIEKTLVGMRAGGFRKVRVSPHLAYGSRGIPGLIPSDAAHRSRMDAQSQSTCQGHRANPVNCAALGWYGWAARRYS